MLRRANRPFLCRSPAKGWAVGILFLKSLEAVLKLRIALVGKSARQRFLIPLPMCWYLTTTAGFLSAILIFLTRTVVPPSDFMIWSGCSGKADGSERQSSQSSRVKPLPDESDSAARPLQPALSFSRVVSKPVDSWLRFLFA